LNKINVFYELPCLTEHSSLLSGEYLVKTWFRKADKRHIPDYLVNFINYNKRNFDFLGVVPYITGSSINTSLFFRSSNFVGAIPLRSPETGLQIGDFVVSPRFSNPDRYSEHIQILNYLKSDIQIERQDSIPLRSGVVFQPPFYLEACYFIDSLAELINHDWVKFSRQEKTTIEPLGQINWNKYLQNEYKVENRLRYPVTKNILIEDHKEYRELKYVFELCKKEIYSSRTPFQIKSKTKSQINIIDERLLNIGIDPTNRISIHSYDSVFAKNAKSHANNILNANFVDCTAWRVDFNEIFERYTQRILFEVAKEIGWELLSNYKIHKVKGNYFSWSLNYLEPDFLIRKDRLSIFGDAKYKSHLFNKFDTSEQLKSDFRNDLHQILCYSSFSNLTNKVSFLCYPTKIFEITNLEYQNGINGSSGKVYLIGIPLNLDHFAQAKTEIKNLCFVIESELSSNK